MRKHLIKSIFGKSSSASGFTVFEVLISVGLLSIGLVALAGMQVIGVRGNVDGEMRSDAAAIASAKFNELSSLNYTMNLEDGSIDFDPKLTQTGDETAIVWVGPELVNKHGYSAATFTARFPSGALDFESFPYELYYMIEDVGDSSKPGGYKKISVKVDWVDRSVRVAGQKGSVLINQVPRVPQYN